MGTGEGEVCAVLCGYVGSRYHGLQKHDNGPPTVEEELESALIKAGALVYKDGITIFTTNIHLYMYMLKKFCELFS